MTRHTRNRNGHLCNFAAFAPVRRSTEEIVRHAIAWRDGTPLPSGPPPTPVHSTKSLDLVRFRLNSDSLAAAFRSLGYGHADCHDEYADWSARFGIIDRESGEAVAILWIVNDPNHDRGFELAEIVVSSSNPGSVNKSDVLEILNELDIPPGHNTTVAGQIADRFDLWYADGSWEIREPRTLLAFRFSSICFDTNPPLEDIVSVFVEMDPEHPLDGHGNETDAYWNLQHHRNLAWDRFSDMYRQPRPGFSSWGDTGQPQVVKITGPSLDESLRQTATIFTGTPASNRP